MNGPNRREFLVHTAGATAGVLLLPAFSAAISKEPSVKFPAAPRDRVAIASYPFREFIAGEDHKSGNSTVELKDFAAHVVEKFNVHKIEPWTGHFPDPTPKYLAEFRSSVEKVNAGIANIAVDGENCPYALNKGEREKAIEYSKKWIDVAVAIGSPSVRTNIPPAKDSKPDLQRLAESLGRVAEYAASKNVVVHLENDNPNSEDPFFLAQVIEKVNNPWLHALPDFGNTVNAHEAEYAYRGIDAMFAHAYGICHVKDGETNQEGKASHVDLPRTFGILKKHGYKGYCSIEYDTAGDPYKPTAELVNQTISFLS